MLKFSTLIKLLVFVFVWDVSNVKHVGRGGVLTVVVFIEPLLGFHSAQYRGSEILPPREVQISKISWALRRGYSTCPRLSAGVLPQDKQPPFVRHDKLCHRDSCCCCCFVKVSRATVDPITASYFSQEQYSPMETKTFEARTFPKPYPGIFSGSKNQPLEPPQILSSICRWQFPRWQRFDKKFVHRCDFVAATNLLTAEIDGAGVSP